MPPERVISSHLATRSQITTTRSKSVPLASVDPPATASVAKPRRSEKRVENLLGKPHTGEESAGRQGGEANPDEKVGVDHPTGLLDRHDNAALE